MKELALELPKLTHVGECSRNRENLFRLGVEERGRGALAILIQVIKRRLESWGHSPAKALERMTIS